MENLFNFIIESYDISEYCNSNLLNNYSEYELKSKIGKWVLKSFHSGNENFKKFFPNICASVQYRKLTIKVVKSDDKISLKLLQYDITRRQGEVFFRKQTRVDFITYNFNTNSLFNGYWQNYHKKKKQTKSIRQNFFVSEPLDKISVQIRRILYTYVPIKQDKNVLEIDSTEIVHNAIKTFVNNIPGMDMYSDLNLNEKLFKRHYDYVGVKFPDNWMSFKKTYPFPTKKILKKNKMKLIDSVMSLHNIKGEKVKRILHNIPEFINSETYNNACKIFGEDFILGQPDELIKTLFKNLHVIINPSLFSYLNKMEMKNCWEIYKLILEERHNLHTFDDHLSMYNRLKKFENIKWRSKNYNEFVQEHVEFSDKLNFYTKGKFERVYDNDFVKEIQESILGNYYPVLLRTSDEYNEESTTQSNCVKTYIDRPSSIIISLRKDSINSNERATIEFYLYKENSQINIKNVQTLGRFNKPLTEDWNQVVNVLNNKMKYLVSSDSFELPKVIKEIGGQKIHSNSEFKVIKPNGSVQHYMVWVDEKINGNEFAYFRNLGEELNDYVLEF